MSQLPSASQLPPKLPPDLNDISRAVCLLGNRIASDLKDKAKVELIGLIGVYPSQEQAKHWKQSLKRMLKEGIEPDRLEQQELATSSAPGATAPESTAKKSTSKKSTSRKSAIRKFSDQKPKRLRQNPPTKVQQQYKRHIASNEFLYPGVSNLAGIDLDLLRDEDDWGADFGY
jgi:hypothetical protein